MNKKGTIPLYIRISDEVGRLIRDGVSLREISNQLGISYATAIYARRYYMYGVSPRWVPMHGDVTLPSRGSWQHRTLANIGHADAVRYASPMEMMERERWQRPRTRGDCVDGERPCPWVGCR